MNNWNGSDYTGFDGRNHLVRSTVVDEIPESAIRRLFEDVATDETDWVADIFCLIDGVVVSLIDGFMGGAFVTVINYENPDTSETIVIGDFVRAIAQYVYTETYYPTVNEFLMGWDSEDASLILQIACYGEIWY